MVVPADPEGAPLETTAEFIAAEDVLGR